ncbi:MAG: lipid-binding protein [Sphingobacteriaceae bacterium]
MKLKNLKYFLIASTILIVTSCDSMPEPEIEHAPIWPLAGEWLVHVYNPDGTAFGATPTNPLGTLFALRTYNTSDNARDKAWMRLGTTQAVAILGKVNCDPEQKVFTGQNIPNESKANQTFTILNGQVLLAATVLHSGVTADSIAITYTSTATGATHTAKGHRTSHFIEDQY